MGPGDVIAQTYEVVRRIGAGGMGAVFEARHLRLPKRVAIKVLTTALEPDLVARFHQEAQIASSLGNPHIVDVIDVGTTPAGTPYMVMELLDGESLRDRIRRGRLPLVETLRILRQVASALHAAHRENVIHRDLKPENVFLQREGVSGADHVKLLDFGVSKVQGAIAITAQNVVMGTPAYMAPEQATGNTKLIDTRVDQFALAMIGYELVADLPFPVDDTTRLMHRIAFEPVPSLASRSPSTPAHVTAAIDRALSQHPHLRFATMTDFIDALDGKEVAEPQGANGLVDGSLAREGTKRGAVAATHESEARTVNERPALRRRSHWPLLLALFVASVGVASIVLVLRRDVSAVTPTVDAASGDAANDAASDAANDAAAPIESVDAPPPIDAPPPVDAAPPPDAARSTTVTRSEPEAIPPEVAEDLARAQRALNANDLANATRFAKRTLEVKPTRSAYLILVEIACRSNDLAAARGWMRTMPAAVKPRAKNICAGLGIEL